MPSQRSMRLSSCVRARVQPGGDTGLMAGPLSSVDAAWLRMEDPTNLMMVTGVLLFDGRVRQDHDRAERRRPSAD